MSGALVPQTQPMATFSLDRKTTFAVGLTWPVKPMARSELEAIGARLHVNRSLASQSGWTADERHVAGQWSAAAVAAANETAQTWYGIFEISEAPRLFWVIAVLDGMVITDAVKAPRDAMLTAQGFEADQAAKWVSRYCSTTSGTNFPNCRVHSLPNLLGQRREGRLQRIIHPRASRRYVGAALMTVGMIGVLGAGYLAWQWLFARPARPVVDIAALTRQAAAVAPVQSAQAAAPAPKALRYLPDPGWAVGTCADALKGLTAAAPVMADGTLECRPANSTAELTATLRAGDSASGRSSLTAMSASFRLPPDATQPDAPSGYQPQTTIGWLTARYAYRDTITVTHSRSGAGAAPTVQIIIAETAADWAEDLSGMPLIIHQVTFKRGQWTVLAEVR